MVAWADAMKMACDGTIEDAKTLVGLLYYDRVHSGGELRAPRADIACAAAALLRRPRRRSAVMSRS